MAVTVLGLASLAVFVFETGVTFVWLALLAGWVARIALSARYLRGEVWRSPRSGVPRPS